MIVGVEYDARDEDLLSDLESRVQLCQWVFMGKAGHPVLQGVVDHITQALQDVGSDKGTIEVTARSCT